jgi:hypothetical protein
VKYPRQPVKMCHAFRSVTVTTPPTPETL